jgi:hypothetical protein
MLWLNNLTVGGGEFKIPLLIILVDCYLRANESRLWAKVIF